MNRFTVCVRLPGERCKISSLAHPEELRMFRAFFFRYPLKDPTQVTQYDCSVSAVHVNHRLLQHLSLRI